MMMYVSILLLSYAIYTVIIIWYYNLQMLILFSIILVNVQLI